MAKLAQTDCVLVVGDPESLVVAMFGVPASEFAAMHTGTGECVLGEFLSANGMNLPAPGEFSSGKMWRRVAKHFGWQVLAIRRVRVGHAIGHYDFGA